MNSNLEQLIRLLKQEVGLYRSLLVVIDQEKEAAVRSDLVALNETGADKDKILFDGVKWLQVWQRNWGMQPRN